jgi:RNA polymerase sigma-70 factor (ECF subfamily)
VKGSRALADAEHLFSLHRQGVFRYLCRVVGRPDTAQDLTQEVFLRVTRATVPAADPAGHKAWVFSIARNLGLNYLRDGRRRGQHVELLESPAPATQDMALSIRDALAGLAATDREVFLLRESAGLSYDEIAAACDLSVEGVRGRLRRAREALRESLAGEMQRARRGVISIRGGSAAGEQK